MRKTEVIVTLALTVVMLAAMTGMAAAAATVNPDPASGSPGSSVTIEVTVDPGEYVIGLIENGAGAFEDSNGIAYDWAYWFKESSSKTVPIRSTDLRTVHLVVDIPNSAAEGDYHYTAYDLNMDTYQVLGSLGIIKVGIPEFATIAIPVAAIFGLVLFFNHRKRKKE